MNLKRRTQGIMSLETYFWGFYNTLCNADEIARILTPKTAQDYLLKLRANATVEHVRIFRVLRSRMIEYGDAWNFTASFDQSPFENYKTLLTDQDREAVHGVACGFVFCNEPNGRIIKTDFGNVITLSLSLRYFLRFMNLAFLHFNETGIPGDVRGAAIKIALRTMLQSEALDFDLDPRGDIPTEIAQDLDYHTDLQLQFVVGHEFSHYFLGHLDSRNVVDDPFLTGLDSSRPAHRVFSYAQQEELDADIDAIQRPLLDTRERSDLLNRALFFFAYLDIFQAVREQISPSPSHHRTHPSPIDRIHNLLDKFQGQIEIDEHNIANLLRSAKQIKLQLIEDVALNIDSYELYGSIYLGSWHTKKLVDRVDY